MEVRHGAPASEADIEDLFEKFIPMQLSVLKDFTEPIPGLLDVVEKLRDREIKIGTTTGYLRSMMDAFAPKAKENGYEPDNIVCPDEVPAGRPYCYPNAIQLGVFPMQAMVKVGDTLVDIEEGLNAGMWTVGLSLTGNLLGLNESEVNALSPENRDHTRNKIESKLYQAGAHYVMEGIWDLPSALDDIHARLARGEQP